MITYLISCCSARIAPPKINYNFEGSALEPRFGSFRVNAPGATTTEQPETYQPDVLAAIVGWVCLLALVLHAVLVYLGAPGYRLELRDAPELLLLALFAAYGICIGFRGKAPAGLLPWK